MWEGTSTNPRYSSRRTLPTGAKNGLLLGPRGEGEYFNKFSVDGSDGLSLVPQNRKLVYKLRYPAAALVRPPRFFRRHLSKCSGLNSLDLLLGERNDFFFNATGNGT